MAAINHHRKRTKLQVFKDFEDKFGWQITIFNDNRNPQERERALFGMFACCKFYLEHQNEIPAEIKPKIERLAEMANDLILQFLPED